MHERLTKLMELGGEPLAPGNPAIELERSSISEQNRGELNELFSRKNGFLAFEAALYVFPVQSHEEHIGIVDWNVSATWKFAYGGRADAVFCFAQDIFGNQFALVEDKVVTFECETGEASITAGSIGEWAGLVLKDFDFITGHRFAQSWQRTNRRLTGRERLFPKRPFVAGGAYEDDNLISLAGEDVLRFFGDFSGQIRDKPDGSNIRLVVKADGQARRSSRTIIQDSRQAELNSRSLGLPV